MKLYHYTTHRVVRQAGRRAMLRPLNELDKTRQQMSWWGALLWLTDLDVITDWKAFGMVPSHFEQRYVVDADRVVGWLECPMREALQHAPSYSAQLAEFDRDRAAFLDHFYVSGGAQLGLLDRHYTPAFDIAASSKAFDDSQSLGGRANGLQDVRKMIADTQTERELQAALGKRNE